MIRHRSQKTFYEVVKFADEQLNIQEGVYDGHFEANKG